ncbi:MAG: MscL family protein [Tepidisphaeraceae bacterium]
MNFAIIAFCIFLVIKAINTAKRRFEKQQAADPPAPPPDVQLLTEIRDILKSK